MTGDQILESRKADKEYAWEKNVLEFKNWMVKQNKVKGSGKLSENTAKTATMMVRGFFAFHRLPLEFRRTENVKLVEAQPLYEDYRFNLEDLKNMFDVADLTEKYILTAGKSFGLRAGDFLRLTRGDLEAYLNRPVPISIGKYSTKKESVPAYPFIDSDALPIIKLMIKKMDREGRTKPADRILTFKDAISLTRALQRIIRKAGINIGNKRVRFHCLRKFLTDHLSSYMSESKWKQICGKKISEGAYISPDSLRNDYERTMKETCFSKIVGETDVEKIVKKQVLLNVLKNLGITEKEATSMFSRRRTLKRRTFKPNIDAEIEFIEELIKEKRNSENDCPDGEHCERFEQIPEANLLEYLRQGWQIVKETNNGKEVIVRKQ